MDKWYVSAPYATHAINAIGAGIVLRRGYAVEKIAANVCKSAKVLNA